MPLANTPTLSSYSLPPSAASNVNDNHSVSLSLLPLNDGWILSIFILCLCGILCTIIMSFVFICLSYRRLNGQFLLTTLFICFSTCFIYITIIICLIRANELFCGLREFLSQFAYTALYSALLCRYIMQWLGSRILSQHTKQLTSLLVYLLLIFIQIPIGILWWYFTIPRVCQQRNMNILSSTSKIPKLMFNFQKPIMSPTSSIRSCSNRCIVDYRFYATFIYIILELFFCTIIATCLFLCRHCHRNQTEKDKVKTPSINSDNRVLAFLNMFAFILIDLIWLMWTFIYYFTHPFFIFPSLIIGMFMIATICLLFILLPQLCYSLKMKINDINIYKLKANAQPTTLYSNKLASIKDVNDQELLLKENSSCQKPNRQKEEQQALSSGSELSYELGASGTFLPITRTPKRLLQAKTNKTSPIQAILDISSRQEHPNTQTTSNNQNGSVTTEVKEISTINPINQKEEQLRPPTMPLQRLSTSSSIASDFVTPVLNAGHLHETDSYQNRSFDVRFPASAYYSKNAPPSHDETIIPILCNSERLRTSIPAEMPLVVNSPSSSVPLNRRIHSGTGHRYVRRPYHHIYPPPTTPFYSPRPHQYLFVDPYRTVSSHLGSNTWRSVLLQPEPTSHRYPHSYQRFHIDNRLLSQRLWDIDSGDDDDDEVEEDIMKVAGRAIPTTERLCNVHSNYFENEHNILLHIDDDEEHPYEGK